MAIDARRPILTFRFVIRISKSCPGLDIAYTGVWSEAMDESRAHALARAFLAKQ